MKRINLYNKKTNKKSPCIGCLCLPVCGNKVWIQALMECDLLTDFVRENHGDKHEMIFLKELIMSKELYKENP